MPTAEKEFEKLVVMLTEIDGVSAGKLFGKPCAKVHGKAFLAQQQDWVVFKLNGPSHKKALALEGARLWDPSGKGRAMKEWVALPASHSALFAQFGKEALEYVSSAT